MDNPLIEVRGVSKAFGGVQALQQVSLSIAPGEVHALCGENGAGKSTLIKILSGSYVPDAGEVLLGGKPLPLGDVSACEAAGIAVIHQESVAFAHLNAEDNIFVGREPTRAAGLLLDRPRMRRETAALLERLGEKLDQRVPVGDLPVAQRQMVGMARALSHSCRLIIMDEPTASLSGRETAILFQIIRQLRAEGVSVLYVSHRLEEVFELSDRVSVLRDGRYVATHPIPEIDREGLIKLMVGREVSLMAGEGAGSTPGKVLLEVRGLSREGAFEDVSFEVRAGEIVGLAGLVGAGRSEVARAIFGVDRPDGGTVRVAGETLPAGSVRAAMQHGVALVPEDRQHLGLVLPMPVGANLTLAVLRSLSRAGFPSARAERDLIARLMKELDIRAAGPEVPAETLSGGNQQKIVIGKWLAGSPRVLILDEPTRGVDVGAKAEVHRLVRELASKGVAVLLISSELPEILGMSDRVLVMRAGRIAGELPRADATQEKILALALAQGAGQAEAPALGQQRAADPAEPPAGRKSAICNLQSAIPTPSPPHPFAARLWRLAEQREYGVLALLFLTFAVVASVNRAFISPQNIRDMLVQCAPAGIVACGLTLVIVTGEIDISVGSLMGVLAAALGLLTSTQRMGLPPAVGILVALFLGTAIGCVSGVLVAWVRVPSIIVTLGMLTALQGLTEVLMGGEWIHDLPPAVRYLGTGAPLGIPVCLWVAAVVIGATTLLAYQTPLGRRIYAVGSSKSAARLAGVSARRIKVFVFALTGFLTGVATLVSVPQLSVIEAGIGQGFELLVVTCVVVGGTSISGGKGTLVGSMLGVLLLGIVRTVLIFLKLGDTSVYWERAIQGGFILLAVLLDHLARRRSGSEAQA